MDFAGIEADGTSGQADAMTPGSGPTVLESFKDGVCYEKKAATAAAEMRAHGTFTFAAEAVAFRELSGLF